MVSEFPAWAAVLVANAMVAGIAAWELRWVRHHEYFNSPLSLTLLELVHEIVLHVIRCGAMYHSCRNGQMATVIVVSLMMIGIEMEINFTQVTCHFESLWMNESCSDFFRTFSAYALFPYTAVIAARRSFPVVARPFAAVLFGCWSHVAWEIGNNGCGWIHLKRDIPATSAGHDILGGAIENYFWSSLVFEATTWLDASTNRVGRRWRTPLRLVLAVPTLQYWLRGWYPLRILLLAALGTAELAGIFDTGFWFVALAGGPMRLAISWMAWYGVGGQDGVIQKFAQQIAPYVGEELPRFKASAAVLVFSSMVVWVIGRRRYATPAGRQDWLLVSLATFWQAYVSLMLLLGWYGVRIPCPEHWSGCRSPGFHEWTDDWYKEHLGWVVGGGLLVVPFHLICLGPPRSHDGDAKKAL